MFVVIPIKDTMKMPKIMLFNELGSPYTVSPFVKTDILIVPAKIPNDILENRDKYKPVNTAPIELNISWVELKFAAGATTTFDAFNSEAHPSKTPTTRYVRRIVLFSLTPLLIASTA